MKFQKERIKDLYLLDTRVENIFINEYLPVAPGDYVKVCLYILMYAEHQIPINIGMISRELKINEKDVDDALAYWEAEDIIKRNKADEKENIVVTFISQKNKLYGMKESFNEKEEVDDDLVSLENKEISEIYSLAEETVGRTISPREMESIKDAIKVYGINPDVLSYSFKYCSEKDKLNINYIITVAKSWAEKDCVDVLQVKKLLNTESKENFRYNKIFKRLGFNRTPGPADVAIMKKWFDELGYTLDKVLDACDKTGGIRNPNLNYVNKILMNWREESKQKGVDINSNLSELISDEDLEKYLKELRYKEEEESREKLNEIYGKLPEVLEIDKAIDIIENEFPKTVLMGVKGKEKREKLKSEIVELNFERAEILENKGYPADYTDIKYLCSKCKDKGYLENGGKCSCIGSRREEAKMWIQKNKIPL
ncbi:MAG TPA: DnaD domain protein [Anaerovoracaceae bacterium]|nr:DnaD domain protein [Anaerovoracaceae bacterium]